MAAFKKNQNYNGNPLLKKEGVKIKFTPELIREWQKCQKEPLYFITKYCKIVTDDGLSDFKPHSYQKEIINSVIENRNTIVTTSRQAGKSTALISVLLWYILFNEYKSVGMFANKAETARMLLKRLKVAFQHLPKWLQQGIRVWNEGRIEIENGSRIIADSTTGNSARGETFQFIFIDEAAHIENWEDFFTSVYPTISAGKDTKICLVSTPLGLNHYWNIWQGAIQGKNGYHPIFVTWKDVPGRDEEWYKKTMESLNGDQSKFDQEFNAEFQGSSGTLIAGWKLKQLYAAEPDFIDPIGLKQYQKPVKDHSYYILVDTSRGKGLDYSAFQVIDVTMMPYQQVCTFKSNVLTPYEYAEIIHQNCLAYNNAFLLIESNDLGSQVCDIIYHDFEYESILKTENGGHYGKRVTDGMATGYKAQRGITTSKQVKRLGCSVLKLLIEQNQLLINDFDTIQELSRFSKKKDSYEAEPGANDDLVIGLMLFAWMSQNQFFKDTTNINTLSHIRDRAEEEIQNLMVPIYSTNGTEDLNKEKIMPVTKTWLTDFLKDDNSPYAIHLREIEQREGDWVKKCGFD